MSDSPGDGFRPGDVLNSEDRLRQALMRLTSPQVEELQGELSRLKTQLDELKKLEGDTTELQSRVERIGLSLLEVEKRSKHLIDELRDPSMIGHRLDTTIVPALHRQVDQNTDNVAETLAPVIGPAMRHQIRDAKDDIVDALYPVIGQIINKAISESLRELTRRIDARMRRQLNFRDRISQALARLRGVSGAELYIRDSLPYSIERVFLIHRETGLLFAHVSEEPPSGGTMDTISGMLTAIQDFVRDSFSGGEGELEEVTHGDRRILLEGGHHAYVAVVLRGVEPEGYNTLIRDTIRHINVEYENELREFDGDMGRLPNMGPHLMPLLKPQSEAAGSDAEKPLSRSQKRVAGFILAGLILLVTALVFACVFVVRLWPVAFPGPAPEPTMTPTSIPSPIPTPTPVPTFTPTIVPTFTTTSTSAPTNTPLIPTASPQPTGLLTGNLNVRLEPSFESASLGVILAGETVIIREMREDWYLVSWPANGAPQLEGWINGDTYLELP